MACVKPHLYPNIPVFSESKQRVTYVSYALFTLHPHFQEPAVVQLQVSASAIPSVSTNIYSLPHTLLVPLGPSLF